MAKEVVISNSSLNSYGFRVMTEGIDTTQYQRNPILLWMHHRADRGIKEEVLPIGRIDNLRVDGDSLIGTPVFDESDDFAQRIKAKWENGTLKMVSMGIDLIEQSDSPEVLVQGQIRSTVTRSKLTEVSIVDIGANDDALVLYDENHNKLKLVYGEDCQVPRIKLNKDNNQKESKMKEIALKLGLSETASEAEVLTKVSELQMKADKVQSLEFKIEQQESNAIEAEIKNAINLHKVTEDKKEHFIALGKKIGAVELKALFEDMTQMSKPSEVIGKSREKRVEKLSDMTQEQMIALKEKDKAEYGRLYKAEYGVELEME
jgi:Caudovirus prohead protease.